MSVSLALFVASILMPWLMLHTGVTLAAISQFWSYQAIMKVSYSARSVTTFILRFGEYWFVSPEYAYPSSIYYGWVLIFALQIVGIATGVASVIKGIKNKLFPIFTTVCFLCCLLLGVFQFLRQSAGGFVIGFWLALFSTALWTVPLWIEKVLKSKIRSLTLLVFVTGIPSVFFMLDVASILSFFIRMGGGDFWFDWNRQLIGVAFQGARAGMYVSSFVLGLISVPLLLASILLLCREMQNRKGT